MVLQTAILEYHFQLNLTMWVNVEFLIFGLYISAIKKLN